ncbi:MAG: RuBisCO large subunit C-terminal-like domain-containing protein [Acidobacteriota bacterium]|nr:RuBisCO large subunit C-terminal-like domain-containing protein [Acidobacteriota bacterium]
MDPIRATYRVSCNASEIEARAEALAREQTTELPRGAAPGKTEERVLGRVETVEQIQERTFDVEILLPAATQDGSAAQLLNVLFGNSSLQADVVLADAQIPHWLVERFPGPRHGALGLRRVTGVPRRALTCTALKPQGLSPLELRALCETFARAGIDVIKDDHGLADQETARFEERVRACRDGLRAVWTETGHRAVYVPSLSGGPREVHRQLDIAEAHGILAVMLAPMLLGASLFAEIAATRPGLVLLAHPSFAGATRIEPELLLGSLFRLFGADAVIFPHHGGRFGSFDAGRCRAIARRLALQVPGLRAAMPVPAGGMDERRAGEIVSFYGADAMLLVGGSLYIAGEELLTRARRFVKAVAVASEDVD